jgi:hypothetical protein
VKGPEQREKVDNQEGRPATQQNATPKVVQRAKLEKVVGKHVELTWDYDNTVQPDDVVF